MPGFTPLTLGADDRQRIHRRQAPTSTCTCVHVTAWHGMAWHGTACMTAVIAVIAVIDSDSSDSSDSLIAVIAIGCLVVESWQ